RNGPPAARLAEEGLRPRHFAPPSAQSTRKPKVCGLHASKSQSVLTDWLFCAHCVAAYRKAAFQPRTTDCNVQQIVKFQKLEQFAPTNIDVSLHKTVKSKNNKR
ncbi:MAG: hypothetical protein ACN6NT_05315, partial [Comamonas sp.]